jgi:hypothetical protein
MLVAKPFEFRYAIDNSLPLTVESIELPSKFRDLCIDV